ncbi:unnamed protein product, partial [Ectocarpus sp. 12 AP-2014]
MGSSTIALQKITADAPDVQYSYPDTSVCTRSKISVRPKNLHSRLASPPPQASLRLEKTAVGTTEGSWKARLPCTRDWNTPRLRCRTSYGGAPDHSPPRAQGRHDYPALTFLYLRKRNGRYRLTLRVGGGRLVVPPEAEERGSHPGVALR